MPTILISKLKISFFVFAVLLLTAAMIQAEDWGKVSDEEWNIGAPEDYPNANAIILFNVGSMEVSTEFIEFKQHIRMKILNKAGIDEIGDIEIPYYKDDKIKKMEAHTITPDGKKHKVKKKEYFRKKSGYWRTKTFAFPALDSGVIVEYRYTNRNSRYRNLDPWLFQTSLYTCYSRFGFKLHRGFTYSTATMNIPRVKQKPFEEQVSVKPKVIQYSWELDHLPPVKSEPYMSFAENYVAGIYNQLVFYEDQYQQINFARNWRDISEPIQERIDLLTRKKGKLEKLIDSLTAGMTGVEEKTRAIYKYVCNEIHWYIDPDDDRSFWDKNLSEYVEKKQASYSGKNLLLTRLLQLADIPAWPLYIGDRDNTIFLPQFISDDQFNKYIVMVESGDFLAYLDACSKYIPFGVLAPDSRMAGGLLIDGKKSQLVNIIRLDPKSFRQDITKMYIDTDGNASCSTTADLRGYYAYYFGEWYDDADDKDKYVEDFFFDNYDGQYELDSHHVDLSDNESIKISAYYTIEEYSRFLDNNLLFNQIQLKYDDNPFKNELRSFPVDFNYKFDYQNLMQIDFADSITSYTLPEPVQLQINGASFSRNCMFNGSGVVLQANLKIAKPVFIPMEYKSLRELFIQIATASEDEFIVGFE